MGAIESVRKQTYRPLEHIIVSEGPDPTLVFERGRSDVPIRFVELGRNWSSEVSNSYSAAAMNVAMLMARGTYQSWLSDDERMVAHHVELMVHELEAADVDFVYPRVAYYRWDNTQCVLGIGCSPPIQGSITTILYRAVRTIEAAKGPYRMHATRAGDWDFVSRAIAGGATYKFVDAVTFSHRDDVDAPPVYYQAPLPEFAR